MIAQLHGQGRIIVNLNEVKRVLVSNKSPDLPAFLYINKNGITTMSHAFRENAHPMEAYFKEEYPQARSVVTMWREPYDRIESSYRFLKFGTKLTDTFEEFIVRNCTEEGHDPHQLPQFEVASDKYGRFVPDQIVRWDWGEIQRIYGFKTMPHLNVGKEKYPLPWTKSLRAMYRERYAMDFAVWAGADVLSLKLRPSEERREPLRKRL